jgi:hypothetical protein
MIKEIRAILSNLPANENYNDGIANYFQIFQTFLKVIFS